MTHDDAAFEADMTTVHAYVDGELAQSERAALLARANGDPALQATICRLAALKEQVRLAYQDPPLPGRARSGRPWCLTGARAATAAAAALLLGLAGGWLLHHAPVTADRLVLLDSEGRGAAPATADSPELRLVVHVASADQAKAGNVLDEVESLLEAYERDGQPLRVEVIANGEGLNLLRAGFTDHAQRIHDLSRRYSNLTFVACKNTMDRLRAAHGIEVRLVPDAEVTESGVSRVVQRQRQGWGYLQS
jgi:intracellular sulfur oxidation DsrE/DsrF family protein